MSDRQQTVAHHCTYPRNDPRQYTCSGGTVSKQIT
ncbi:hypothetical protein BLA6860_03234 [Burkholderia lata]|nr:hypothetical protein BLA6860_03234 [Burkholderia lata]